MKIRYCNNNPLYHAFVLHCYQSFLLKNILFLQLFYFYFCRFCTLHTQIHLQPSRKHTHDFQTQSSFTFIAQSEHNKMPHYYGTVIIDLVSLHLELIHRNSPKCSLAHSHTLTSTKVFTETCRHIAGIVCITC